jgi:hypothetical protein
MFQTGVQGEMKHKFYVNPLSPYIFTILEIIKQRGYYEDVLELSYSITNHGLLSTIAILRKISFPEF